MGTVFLWNQNKFLLKKLPGPTKAIKCLLEHSLYWSDNGLILWDLCQSNIVSKNVNNDGGSSAFSLDELGF